MDLTKLKEPFPADCIEWRIGQSGRGAKGPWATCMAYVQARSVMDRLDETVGPGSWKVEYRMMDKGFIAALSIKVGNEWVTKEDGSEPTDIESFKGGISGALKRAAVLWGIGRYLYDLETGYAEVYPERAPGRRWAKTKDGTEFYWTPPKLPDWALPKKAEGVATQTQGPSAPTTAVPKPAQPSRATVNTVTNQVTKELPKSDKPGTLSSRTKPVASRSVKAEPVKPVDFEKDDLFL